MVMMMMMVMVMMMMMVVVALMMMITIDHDDVQAVPCPLSIEDCQWPTEFHELLDMRFTFIWF